MSTSIHETFRDVSDSLSGALEFITREGFSPSNTKTQRRYALAEVADFLGITQNHLRKAHFDKRIPEVEATAGNRRAYSGQDIWDIRNAMAKNDKTRRKFLPGSAARGGPVTIAVSNFKGGAGKSTLACNLANGLALKGYRVLLADSDPQASSTTFFGYFPEIDFADSGTLHDALRYPDAQGEDGPVPISTIIRKTYFHNVDLVPGGLMLAEFEHETPKALSALEQPVFYRRIAAALDEVRHDYDVILLDCPPALGYTTMAALCASDIVLVPVIPVGIDVASLSQFLNMAASLMEVVSRSGNVSTDIDVRFLISRHDVSEKTQGEMIDFLRQIIGDRVMTSVFLKSSAVSEAGAYRKTLYDVSPATDGINRQTYERAINSINAVTAEVETLIHNVWERR